MIGIYKFTNNLNNKVYIGLSNDIERRYHEHINHANSEKYRNTGIAQAIHKYGIENFTFEVIEQFEVEDRTLLGEREQYWIKYYHSTENDKGYNNTIGGDLAAGRAKLTKEDVIAIRTRYAKLERCIEVFQDYKDRIGRTGFNKIWKGETWKGVMPEVYTPENKEYHKNDTGNPGSRNGRTKLTEEDIYDMRLRDKNKEPRNSIYEDYKDKVTKGSFQNILGYRNWKNIIP